MFQWAHDKDPEMMLFVNDYNIIAGNQGSKYVTFIKELLGQGAPISGIGVQGHFGNHAIDINKVDCSLNTLTFSSYAYFCLVLVLITALYIPGHRTHTLCM